MFSRLDEDNTVDPEYTPGKANPFWEGLNNGALRRGSGNSRLVQKKWVEENLTAGHRYDRGRVQVISGRGGSGTEGIIFDKGLAGFNEIFTRGRQSTTADGANVFTLTVTPAELIGNGSGDRAEVLTITLTERRPNEYEVGVFGPVEGGAAAQALAGTEYLSDAGATNQQGLKYLKLNIGNAATKSFLSEAVRRLAMHNGRAPDAVLYSARDTGARAGDQTVRKFSREIIESKFSRETEAESFGSVAMNDTDSTIPRDQVEAIATRITANWANAPEMVTVATDLDLPADMQERIDKQNARGKIDGVFHKGRFYLIADKIRTEADVERIVLHEALGHYGLRQVFGPAFGMHMDRLFDSVGGYEGIQRLGRKYGFDLSAYWENAEDMPLAERREMMADELIAHIAGTGTVEPDLIQRIAHLVRKGLRKLMADKFQVLKDLQKSIQDAGGVVNNESNAYLAEELFHGKTEEDLRQVRETFIKPLADKMARFGIEQADLDRYLYARHAPERNAHIAEINPDIPEQGAAIASAISIEEALEVLPDRTLLPILFDLQQKFEQIQRRLDAI